MSDLKVNSEPFRVQCYQSKKGLLFRLAPITPLGTVLGFNILYPHSGLDVEEIQIWGGEILGKTVSPL